MTYRLLLVSLFALSGVSFAHAQVSQFNQSGSGAMSQSNIGGGTQSYGSFGNRTLGSGVSGSSSTGFTGNNTSGSGNTFGSTAGSNGTTGQATAGSGVTGNERFLKQNRQGAFVGADSGDSSNAFSQASQGQNNAFGSNNAASQFARMNQQRQNQFDQSSQQNGKKALRISIKADIPTTNRSTMPIAVTRQFETRLKNLPALEKNQSVQVTMQGRMAVLSGTVASERDRKLIAGLAKLEPGISAVQNDLVVASSTTRGGALPAPRQ